MTTLNANSSNSLTISVRNSNNTVILSSQKYSKEELKPSI